MKTHISFWLMLLMMVTTRLSAKKGKKDKNPHTAPTWKPSSMPAHNKQRESVSEGKSLNLDCKANGHPRPAIIWLKDGVEITNTNTMEVKKYHLHLKDVTSDMKGNYTCVVGNSAGRVEWTFLLDVHSERTAVEKWPLDIDGPTNVTQEVGSSVTFRCQVRNDPQASISWQRLHRSPDLAEDDEPDFEFLPGKEDPQILRLSNIQREDEGEYRCLAGSVWGLKYSSAWLAVVDPVTDQELPPLSGLNNNHRINTNNNNEVIEESVEQEGSNIEADTELGQTSTTSGQPKNGDNTRKKNKPRKGKKNKEKNNVEKDFTSSSSTTMKTTSAYTTMDTLKTTQPEIWELENKIENIVEHEETQIKPAENVEYEDSHFNSEDSNVRYDDSHLQPEEDNETVDAENADSIKSKEKKIANGSINSWTIYTIIGAVGGVVLLIGLIAITLTLCWKRDERRVFKPNSI